MRDSFHSLSQKITNAVSEGVFAVVGTRLLKEISGCLFTLYLKYNLKLFWHGLSEEV